MILFVCPRRKQYVTYLGINPTSTVHSVYSHTVLGYEFIPEVYKISFSQMRLSSRRLRNEVGCGSRLPREARSCPCGQIQDVCHVLRDCPLTQPVRHVYISGVNIVFPDIPNDAKVVKIFNAFMMIKGSMNTQIARFVGPTWDPPESCRPQMGPMLAPWTLLSGWLYKRQGVVDSGDLVVAGGADGCL